MKEFQYQLNNNPNLELNKSECELDLDNKTLIFHFTESGGQNESDTQGWFRDYMIVVDSDFIIIGGEYQQG